MASRYFSGTNNWIASYLPSQNIPVIRGKLLGSHRTCSWISCEDVLLPEVLTQRSCALRRCFGRAAPGAPRGSALPDLRTQPREALGRDGSAGAEPTPRRSRLGELSGFFLSSNFSAFTLLFSVPSLALARWKSSENSPLPLSRLFK